MGKFFMLLALFGMAAAQAAQAAPVLQAFEPDSLVRILEKQKGKPFVLILWSLDCEYCQASLQVLSREKRRDKNLRVVTLSTDPAGDAQAAALMRKRLASLGMASDAWAFGAAPAEQLRYVVDPRWHGEMPRSYWFDAQGGKVAYSGVLTPLALKKLAIH